MSVNLPSSQRGAREFLIKIQRALRNRRQISPQKRVCLAHERSNALGRGACIVVIGCPSSFHAVGLSTVTCFYVRRFPTFTGCVAES